MFFGPEIPFAEICKGFRFLPGKCNILSETYNINRNDSVEKKKAMFYVCIPLFSYMSTSLSQNLAAAVLRLLQLRLKIPAAVRSASNFSF
jgi:hypothetical protein